MRRWLVSLVVVASVSACDSSEETAAPPEPAPVAAPAPESEPEPTKLAEEPPFGSVEAVVGAPFIVRGEEKLTAAAGTQLQVGDRITTPKKAKIRLVLGDKTVIAVGAESDVTLESLEHNPETGRKGSMRVALGKFWMQVEKWAGQGESRWNVTTPNAVAGVRGTTLWGDIKVDAICALEGEVEVSSVKNAKLTPVALTAGNCASKLSKGKLAPLAPKPKQVEGFLKQVLIVDGK